MAQYGQEYLNDIKAHMDVISGCVSGLERHVADLAARASQLQPLVEHAAQVQADISELQSEYDALSKRYAELKSAYDAIASKFAPLPQG